MIKNLLYSLFLHLALIAVIYANFNIKIHEEDKSSEIVISMQMLTEKKPEIVKEVPKKIEKEKLKKKKKPKKKPKKEKPKKRIKKKLKKKEIKKPKKEIAKKQVKKKKETEKEEKKEPEKAQEKIENIKNSINNLNLSAREKFNIKNQLRRCYNNATKESDLKSTAQLTIRASIDENGFITTNISKLMLEDNYLNDSSIKITLDHAQRAIELCNPLRNLPLDKYEIWKDISVQFNEKAPAPKKAPKITSDKAKAPKKEETVK